MCGEEKRDEEEEKRKRSAKTVTVQEMTKATCAQLSPRTDGECVMGTFSSECFCEDFEIRLDFEAAFTGESFARRR